MMDLQKQIQTIYCSIQNILEDIPVSIYLYGSITMDDFQYGWSDIDLLCLTGYSITQYQAQRLVGLRQELVEQYRDPVYRLFEGGILSLQSLLNGTPDTVVYWGTSGQQITDTYYFDSFSRYELKTNGVLIAGRDIRTMIALPSNTDMRKAIQLTYEIIRKRAVQTDESLYSCGWLLDIARCIFTLRTGDMIAKTKAGEWALTHQLCPVPETLKKVLLIRKEPLKYKNDPEFKAWTRSLGNDVQRFADVLEQEIVKT
ncbi:aminoglycoside adenylyltransferase domain-containing protein [Chloroflexota bacterium]